MTCASNLVWDAGTGSPLGGRIGRVWVRFSGKWGWGGLICGFVQAWLGWEGVVQGEGWGEKCGFVLIKGGS